MAGEWYLGPAGDLRQLEVPETGLNISDIRYGGVHQGLSGARTVDVTGVKMQISLDLNYLDETQYLWLEAMHTRHIPGPVYLINPMKRNMMSKEASMCKTAYWPDFGVYSITTGYTHNWEWEASYPTGVPGVRSVKRTAMPATGVNYAWDTEYCIPVTVGTTYDFSCYLKSDSAKTMTMGIAWYDKNMGTLSQSTASKSLTTSWTRFDISAAAPANAALAIPYMISTSAGNPTVSWTSTAAQFEVGSTPTTWQMGGGSMVVMIDQMPAISPRYPLRNVSLNLLEA